MINPIQLLLLGSVCGKGKKALEGDREKGRESDKGEDGSWSGFSSWGEKTKIPIILMCCQCIVKGITVNKKVVTMFSKTH